MHKIHHAYRKANEIKMPIQLITLAQKIDEIIQQAQYAKEQRTENTTNLNERGGGRNRGRGGGRGGLRNNVTVEEEVEDIRPNLHQPCKRVRGGMLMTKTLSSFLIMDILFLNSKRHLDGSSQ